MNPDISPLIPSEERGAPDGVVMGRAIPRSARGDPAVDTAGASVGAAAGGSALIEAVARYLAMPDAGFFVSLIGSDGIVLDVNQTALDAAGLAREDIVGRQYWETGWWNRSPRVRAWVRAGFNQALKGERFRFESTYFGADGTERVFECACTPISDQGGEVRFVIQTGLDVTERRRVDEQRRAQEVLQESEARFRHMADNVPIMLWVTGPDGVRSFLSRSWYDFTGQSAGGGLGRGWLAAVHSEDSAAVEATFRTGLAGRKPFQAEYRLRQRGGSYRWALDVAAPWRDAKGEFLGFIGSIVDVTERKRAEDALLDANVKKDNFIATLAHELRNPLAPIRHALGVLREKDWPSPELLWCRDVIDRQVDQMVRLLEDLMDVSRISRGKLKLRPGHLRLDEVIVQAVETARPQIDEGHHELVVSLPPDPIWLHGDATRLAQVFANLLTNAAKYTGAHGVIGLSAEREGDRVAVTVRDTGIGISPEHLPHVFEMFSQVERVIDRSKGGLGIGLSLVRGLVEMHGGRITAESPGPGQGSTFTVRLPTAADAPVQPVGQEDEPATGAPGPQIRILVVDDNRDGADSLTMLLRLFGHDVRTAYDGEDAIRVAEEYRPEVIVLDVGMPKLNGYEVCRRIRQQPWGRDMVLIACTGWGQEEDRRRTEEAGFTHHVVKPVDAAVLRRLIRREPDAGAPDAQAADHPTGGG
jgi:PAS domain S-box-containing protein